MEPNTFLRNNGLEYSVVSSLHLVNARTLTRNVLADFAPHCTSASHVMYTYNMLGVTLQIAFLELTPGSENLKTGT